MCCVNERRFLCCGNLGVRRVHMEKKIYREDHEEQPFDMEDSLIFTARQNIVLEMKRSPIKRYSALFSVLLVFSFASTATRLRHVVLPSLRLCEGFLPNSRLCK